MDMCFNVERCLYKQLQVSQQIARGQSTHHINKSKSSFNSKSLIFKYLEHLSRTRSSVVLQGKNSLSMPYVTLIPDPLQPKPTHLSVPEAPHLPCSPTKLWPIVRLVLLRGVFKSETCAPPQAESPITKTSSKVVSEFPMPSLVSS